MTKNDWTIKLLGKITEVGAGNSAPQDKKYFTDGTMPFFRTADVGRVHFSTDLNSAGDYLNKKAVDELGLKVLPKHTILFPKSGASTFLNHRVMIGVDGVVSSHLATIFTEDNVLQKYIFYFLTTIDAKTLTADQGYPSLRISDLQKVQIPLPPLQIQKQIVERLDKIADAQKLNDELIQKSDELFESMLYSKLFQNTFPHKTIKEISKNLDSKRKPITKSDRTAGIYPYYGASGIVDYVNNYIFDEDLLLISEDGANLVARVAPIAFSVSGKIWVNNHAHVLKFESIYLQKIVEYYLNEIDIKGYVTGSAQPKLNQESLNKIEIPHPEFKEQQNIVAKLSAVQEYKKQLLAQKSLLKELFNSVLHKSMKGEMVN